MCIQGGQVGQGTRSSTSKDAVATRTTHEAVAIKALLAMRGWARSCGVLVAEGWGMRSCVVQESYQRGGRGTSGRRRCV